VDTGKNDVNALDMVYSWNNMTSKLGTQFWYNETARMINGTGLFIYLIISKLYNRLFRNFSQGLS
jgi:hypothetical protein